MGLAEEDPAHSRCGRRQTVEGGNRGQDSSFHVDGHLVVVVEEEEDMHSDAPLLPSSCSFIQRTFVS